MCERHVGVVILNYNNWTETIVCVDSVIDSTRAPRRIYVVDNASTDGSYACMRGHFDSHEKYRDVTCVETGRNGGYAYGNNIGIDLCIEDGLDYALITNSDVVFGENAIDYLLEVVAERERCVIASPCIYDADMNVTSIPRIGHQDYMQFLGLKSAHCLQIPPELRHIKQRVFMVSGCCYAIDIGLFRRMGALDEGTFLYEEEGIMAMQAQSAGYEIWYEPKARIVHNHKSTPSLFLDFHLLKSALYYWKEYEAGSPVQLLFLKYLIRKTKHV